MLTLEEAGLPFSYFKVFSILNVLPIGVDVENGKIERQSSGVKVFIWKILYAVGVSHWLYMFGRLVQSTILEPEKYFRWDHFVLHFGFTWAYAVFYFIGFRLFIKTPEENVMIFNQLFVQREDSVQKMIDQQLQIQIQMESENDNETQESESEVGPRPRPLLTWPPQYSLDELMAKLNPSASVLSGIFVLPILALDSSRPQLLYSSLPPEYQNGYSFSILFAIETLCLAILFFTATFVVVAQMMFLGKCQLEFKRMSLQLRSLQSKFQSNSLRGEISIGIGNGGREIRREIWILRQILKEMQELVLLIELFNRCFPFCIFAWKIFSLSLSIIGYFFVIRHHEDFPLLAVLLGYCSTVVAFDYTVMYEHAFSLPGKMEELKNEFLLTAQKTTSTVKSNSSVSGSKNLRAEMKREINRVQNIGIKVGSFHTMERESTLKFMDFVLRNVVSLLVTFPR